MIYSIYLKQGGRVFRLAKQAEEISNSSVACSCIRKVHSCPQAIFGLFLVKTCGGGAEEWCRTLYFQLFAQTCNEEPLFDRCRSKLQKRFSIPQTNGCTSQVAEFKCGCSLLRREPSQNHFCQRRVQKEFWAEAINCTPQDAVNHQSLVGQLAFPGMMEIKLEHRDRKPYE